MEVLCLYSKNQVAQLVEAASKQITDRFRAIKYDSHYFWAQNLQTEADVIILAIDSPKKLLTIMTAYNLFTTVQSNANIIILLPDNTPPCHATESISQRVTALNAGADIILPEEFHSQELSAHLERFYERRFVDTGFTLTIGERNSTQIKIERHRDRVVFGSEQIELNEIEFKTLEFLAMNKGKTCSRFAIAEATHRGSLIQRENSLGFTICAMRRKISAATDGVHPIITVHNDGFAVTDRFFEMDVQQYKMPRGFLPVLSQDQ